MFSNDDGDDDATTKLQSKDWVLFLACSCENQHGFSLVFIKMFPFSDVVIVCCWCCYLYFCLVSATLHDARMYMCVVKCILFDCIACKPVSGLLQFQLYSSVEKKNALFFGCMVQYFILLELYSVHCF